MAGRLGPGGQGGSLRGERTDGGGPHPELHLGEPFSPRFAWGGEAWRLRPAGEWGGKDLGCLLSPGLLSKEEAVTVASTVCLRGGRVWAREGQGLGPLLP